MSSSSLPGLAANDNHILQTNLQPLSGFLNVGHINAQSLQPSCKTNKFSELQTILEGNFLDIVGVSETWTKSYMTYKSLSVKGYKMIRNDRPKIRGGGVAFYIADNLRARVVEKSCYTRRDQMEYLLVEIGFGHDKVLLGVFYFPNRRGRDLSEATAVLQNYTTMYTNIIIMGDFNNDMLVDQIATRNKSFFQQYNLDIVHNNRPTHYDSFHNSFSLLDFFVVSEADRVAFQEQFWVHGISHHAFIYLSYNIETRRSERDFYYLDFNNFNCEALLEHCALIDFGYLYDSTNVNDQLEFVNTVIRHLLKKHIPRKKIKIGQPGKLYRSPSLDNLRSLRDLARDAWSLDRDDIGKRRTYCAYRNKCNSKSRQLKYALGKRTFNGDLTTKQLWTKIREFGALSDTNDDNHCLQPDDLNKHFTSAQSDGLSSRTDVNIVEAADAFSFRMFEMNELVLAFNSVKSNAVGTDGIPIKFLKIILPIFAPHFLHLFNTIVATSTFPAQWKCAKVIPIAKSSNASTPQDFRPVSILPALSKVWERLAKVQITDDPAVICNIYHKQSGFRAMHSTTTATLDLTESIRNNLDNKLIAILLLLDFSKAFDSINYTVLCLKLKQQFSFSSNACNLIFSYLQNRTQCVSIGDRVSG